MKKVFAAALAALVSFAAFAQSFAISDGEVAPAAEESENASPLKYIGEFGFGFHIMKDGDAAFLDNTPAFGKNREIFFSLFGAEYRPVSWLGVSVLADFSWDAYRLNKNCYWQPADGAVSIVDLSASTRFSEVKKSVLRSFGFDFPVELRLHLGKVDLTAGVVGELNFPGRTKFKGTTTDGGTLKNGDMRVKDIKSLPFTYSYRATLSYDGFGLYFKYNPCSQFRQGSGPQFSYWSVGLIM